MKLALVRAELEENLGLRYIAAALERGGTVTPPAGKLPKVKKTIIRVG